MEFQENATFEKRCVMRQTAVNFTVLATSLMFGAVARAADPQPQRGYFYFPPVKDSSFGYRARSLGPSQDQQQARAVPRTALAAPAVPVGYAVPSRPVTWGVRYGVGYGYPASLFGQVPTPANGQPLPPPNARPMTPAYAQANYGSGSMYLGTPGTAPVTGYSSIYGYAGRFYGPYYGYGPSYYAYGGACGWGTPYNAGYYGSGCYGVNASCRASQRYCTPFGGMFRGCGSGCYLPTPAACPTVCAYTDPCGPMTGNPSATPPAYGTPLPAPSNTAPPTPAPPDAQEPPTPVEKKVTPAPQAGNFPRIPNLPPDA
jgi:hypothetical protein